MPDPFPVSDDINAILDDIWTRWNRGSVDRRSPFHTPVIGSVSERGTSVQRIMVLRKADRNTATLRFHTDIRSTKASEIAARGSVSVLGYDHGAKVQLRAGGHATLIRSGPLADAAWAATSPSSRRSYMTTLPPGTPSDHATSGLPLSFEQTVPTVPESEVGRANFAILVIALDRLEWLHLASSGHRRVAFTRGESGWTSTWLIP